MTKNCGVEENILSAIEQSVEKQLGYFYKPAWKRICGEMLKEESRYAKLLDFLQHEIELCEKIIPCFSPVARDSEYSLGIYKTYKDQICKLCFLITLKEHLIDKRTSNEMRKNIEYTICKEYSVHYSEELKRYV